jgi:hypothetical protein
MRDATGARIRVLEPVLGCEERVVELSSAGGADGEAPAAQARCARSRTLSVAINPRRGVACLSHALASVN